MALESIGAGSTIASLDPANPVGGDSIAQGDDHIRNVKLAVQQTFMNLSATVSAVAAELDIAHKGGTISGNATILGNLSVSGNLVVSGSVSGVNSVNNLQPYAITIDLSGTSGFNPNSLTATRQTQGSYQITHNFGTTNYAVQATPATNVRAATVGSIGSNTVVINTFDYSSFFQDSKLHVYLVR